MKVHDITELLQIFRTEIYQNDTLWYLKFANILIKNICGVRKFLNFKTVQELLVGIAAGLTGISFQDKIGV